MEKPQKPSPKEVMPSRRPSPAVFIWLIIFVFIASLAVMRINPSEKVNDWPQSRFEKEIAEGTFIRDKITPKTTGYSISKANSKEKDHLPHHARDAGKRKKAQPKI
jgi:hypothetical protein